MEEEEEDEARKEWKVMFYLMEKRREKISRKGGSWLT